MFYFTAILLSNFTKVTQKVIGGTAYLYSFICLFVCNCFTFKLDLISTVSSYFLLEPRFFIFDSLILKWNTCQIPSGR